MSTWPEPVIPVQTLSDMHTIPQQYIKPLQDRPDPHNGIDDGVTTIPVVNMSHIVSDDTYLRKDAMDSIDKACREWGFFQVVDHGVSHDLMDKSLETWREFFKLPMEVKKMHANSPTTYEGYGSRLGVEKDAILDWCDYFFLHFYPSSIRDPNKWPTLPTSCRVILGEYGEALVELSQKLINIFSSNLGLGEEVLLKAFGEKSACMRANFYPKCQQPDLTLGLSPHSDPGGLTLLLADHNVAGLQVRKGNKWVTVKSLPNAFIVNLGDQMQILSNGIYKSVEHRVTVNSGYERMSLAFFYNPQGDIPIKPVAALTNGQSQSQSPAQFPCMPFNEYRLAIRRKGPHGKDQVNSLKLSN